MGWDAFRELIILGDFSLNSILDNFEDLINLNFHPHNEKSKSKPKTEHDVNQDVFCNLAATNYNFNVKKDIASRRGSNL